ncbi:MAG TPA: caspase family protein [Rudaea sp.]
MIGKLAGVNAGWRRFATSVATAGFVFAIGIGAPVPRASATIQTRNPEDLLIVDCLLPGQVRKLGSATTYMSARRPIHTTQADCEIRGGEYVASDRANYQTALKVWQGQAEAGDADAQNYVGEIYLKGLGIEPDYARSAQWFEKAAAQGSRRARINLGYQYEQGLGVPKDLSKALNLYRDASGIAGDQLVFASTVTAEVQQAKAETAQARNELASARERNEQLSAQVSQLRQQLRQKQKSYEKTQHELDATRSRLDAEQSKLGVDRDPQYAKLKSDLDTRQAAFDARQKKLESDRQASAKQLADAESEVARLKAREQDLQKQQTANRDQELAKLRASVAQMDDTLGQMRARTQQLQAQIDQNAQERDAQQAKFDEARLQLAREHAKNQESSQLLHLMESQLAEQRHELTAARSQMAVLQSRIYAGNDSGATSNTGFTTASLGGGLRVEILQPALSVTRGSNKPAASVPAAQNAMDVVGRVVAPSGLTKLSVNNDALSVDASGTFKARIAVGSGDGTPVHVAALDNKGEQAVLDFVLVPTSGNKANAAAAQTLIADTLPRGVQLGHFHALVIGNDNYANYPALKNPVADANAIADLLKSRYGYNVRLLTNANRFEILSALNDMREQLKDDDNLLVYYAGHGEVDANKQGYWLPSDAQQNAASSWISNRAVSDILTTMNAKHVLVIADSCYSGTMTRSALATFGGGMPASAWGDWVKTMVAGRSRTALTSGGVQPVADTGRGDHSLFAGALLSVLKDNNELLTGQHLFHELAGNMTLRAAAAGLQQSPEYAPIQFAGHEAGEFFFMPRS